MKTRILWIDDQVEVARTLSLLLAPLNAEVTCIDTAEQGLTMLAGQGYALALIDLAMPPGKWGGLWFLEERLKRQVGTPVIVVSGEGAQQETIRALRLGAVDYVTKEAAAQELVACVERALRHQGRAAFEGHDQDTLALIQQGEGAALEFKSTLRWSIRLNKIDPAVELAVLKSIAGFMNANGGTLLIGVGDQGNILGLKNDRFQNDDDLQLHFWNRVRVCIGPEFTAFLHATIRKIDGTPILRIDCRRALRPVFVKWKETGREKVDDLFFVRAGPQTESLTLPQALRYIPDHFTDT